MQAQPVPAILVALEVTLVRNLPAFGFSGAATRSWKDWDINFPGSSTELMRLFKRYQVLLRRPPQPDSLIDLPEDSQLELALLGARVARASLDLELTSRP